MYRMKQREREMRERQREDTHHFSLYIIVDVKVVVQGGQTDTLRPPVTPPTAQVEAASRRGGAACKQRRESVPKLRHQTQVYRAG